ncbi:MAG: nuclear transport factor 2 family protein [Acidimicrobiales bacterium]
MDEHLALVERLRQAVDDHDVDAVVDCFTSDYRNETPAHPSRGFEGHAQVRANWQRIFAGVPDITAEVLRTADEPGEIWSEWEMRGTRPDGQPHIMRGVIIFGVTGQRIAWARFYLEPLDSGEGGVEAAIGVLVGERESDDHDSA